MEDEEEGEGGGEHLHKFALCDSWGSYWLCQIVELDDTNGASVQLWNVDSTNPDGPYLPLWEIGTGLVLKEKLMTPEEQRKARRKWKYVSTAEYLDIDDLFHVGLRMSRGTMRPVSRVVLEKITAPKWDASKFA